MPAKNQIVTPASSSGAPQSAADAKPPTHPLELDAQSDESAGEAIREGVGDVAEEALEDIL